MYPMSLYYKIQTMVIFALQQKMYGRKNHVLWDNSQGIK